MNASKYIILGTKLVMSSNVEFHRELVPDGNTERIGGGGRFHIDHHNKAVILYGKSEQYNEPNPSMLRKAAYDYEWESGLAGYSILHSTCEYLSEALKNNIKIGEIY